MNNFYRRYLNLNNNESFDNNMISKKTIQIILGTAYLLMGLAMFYRSTEFEGFGIKICLYFIGIILTGGGIKKIYSHVLKEDDHS